MNIRMDDKPNYIKYIKYNGWINNQGDFDFFNRLNGEELKDWNGIKGLYSEILSLNQKEVMPG